VQHKPFLKALRFRRQGTLVAALLTMQALVLGLGGILTISTAKDALTDRIEVKVLGEGARTAENFLSLVRQRVMGPFEHNSPQWDIVQRELEAFKVPEGAQLIVLDRAGRVLCHPQIRSQPGLRKIDFSQHAVRVPDTGEVVPLGELGATAHAVGAMDVLAGRSTLAIVDDPQLNIRVLVHQPEAGMMAAARGVTESVLLWATASGVLLLGVTLLGSSILARKYDSLLVRMNAQLEAEVDQRTRQGLAIRNGLIFGLAKLADYRDTDTGKHLERICQYSAMLATELKREFPEISQPWIEQLRIAASMHDIGKVGIPDSVLLKPGKLTPDERTVMEAHTVIGADTLTAIRRRVGDDDLLNMSIQVTLSHHERFDGKGYPFAIAGDQIPLSARIVALADVYDALTSKRVYKPAMSHEEARKIILQARANHLDPRVVDAFERIHANFDRVRAELAAEMDQRDKFSMPGDGPSLLRDAATTRRAAA
jgi:HD-GYP domain-containing protein (c-di-GMP phosphodiesterase class II)